MLFFETAVSEMAVSKVKMMELSELTITLYNKVWMQKEEGLGVPENKI